MKDPGPLLRPQRGTAAAAFPQRPPSAPPPRRRPSAPPTHPLCPVRPILGPFPSSLPTAAGTGRRDSKHGGDGARSPAASPGSASEGGKTHSSLPRAQLSQSSDKKLVVHHKTTWEAFPDWHHGNNPRSGIRAKAKKSTFQKTLKACVHSSVFLFTCFVMAITSCLHMLHRCSVNNFA
ncbi:uncharacterized protein ACOB8E_001070 isoform 3-T3 [Sarcophilus harrisii]